MKCDACGSVLASSIRYGARDGKLVAKGCDICGGVPKVSGVPDLYFRKPYFDENLGNENHPHGQFVESKEHKRTLMREQGLRESGDRRHGARA